MLLAPLWSHLQLLYDAFVEWMWWWWYWKEKMLMPEMYINCTLHLAIHRPWSSTHLFKFFFCHPWYYWKYSSLFNHTRLSWIFYQSLIIIIASVLVCHFQITSYVCFLLTWSNSFHILFEAIGNLVHLSIAQYNHWYFTNLHHALWLSILFLVHFFTHLVKLFCMSSFEIISNVVYSFNHTWLSPLISNCTFWS